MAQRNSAVAIDASAITLSVLCVLHCLALPFLSTILPFVGVISEDEMVHKVMVLISVVISGAAIVSSLGRRNGKLFAILATLGLLSMVAAAFAEPLHDYETPLTVIGALILASAHFMRWNTKFG